MTGGPIRSLALTPNLQSIKQARRFAEECLAEAEADLRDTVVLLVSEVVSNAILHGGPHGPTASIGLALEIRPDLIRIEVEDTGSNLPVLREIAADLPGGRGLLLVGILAMRWGCQRAKIGKTVWFEVAASSAPGTQAPRTLAGDQR